MRQTELNVALWVVFALLILTGGYLMLRACDLGFLPLFGYASCEAPARTADLAAEREREADLRSNIHAAEIRLALLPVCPKPVPPKPPEPMPPKKGDLQVVRKFELPKKLEDLKGCWQSSRGDIELVSDDAEQKHLGTARFCYCFRSNGQGIAQVRYSDGETCRAGLDARISPNSMSMHHEYIACRKNTGLVAADISCRNDSQSKETVCEIASRGRRPNKVVEQFIRVSDEYCGWSG